MREKEIIKFGIIGVGHIGKRHAAMIRRNKEAALVAVCDVLAPETLGIADWTIPFFDSAKAMLAAAIEMDVVCVCTPNGYHAEHANLILESGRHVVCEKPMGLSKQSCEQVIFKALNVGKKVFCVMQNRYSPPSVWLKEIMDKQLLGDIFMVQINCYWNRDDRYYRRGGKPHAWKGTSDLDGGPLFTQFSHFVDVLYWLFGDITNIKASFQNFTHQHSTEFEDSGTVSFDLVEGGMGVFNYSTAVYDTNQESSLTVIGSQGSVKVGGQYMNEVEYCHIKDYTFVPLPAANPANDYGGYKGSAANHVFVIENVIDVLKKRKTITTNALEGLKVVEIIEKIYANK